MTKVPDHERQRAYVPRRKYRIVRARYIGESCKGLPYGATGDAAKVDGYDDEDSMMFGVMMFWTDNGTKTRAPHTAFYLNDTELVTLRSEG